MSEPNAKYVLRVVFGTDEAQAIAKVCEQRQEQPETFVRHATLNALTIVMLADGLPAPMRDELRRILAEG